MSMLNIWMLKIIFPTKDRAMQRLKKEQKLKISTRKIKKQKGTGTACW